MPTVDDVPAVEVGAADVPPVPPAPMVIVTGVFAGSVINPSKYPPPPPPPPAYQPPPPPPPTSMHRQIRSVRLVTVVVPVTVYTVYVTDPITTVLTVVFDANDIPDVVPLLDRKRLRYLPPVRVVPPAFVTLMIKIGS